MANLLSTFIYAACLSRLASHTQVVHKQAFGQTAVPRAKHAFYNLELRLLTELGCSDAVHGAT